MSITAWQREYKFHLVAGIVLALGFAGITIDHLLVNEGLKVDTFADEEGSICAVDGSQNLSVAAWELKPTDLLTYQVITCADKNVVDQGDDINYLISVINTGNETLKQLEIEVGWSDGLTYKTGSGKKTMDGASTSIEDDWTEKGYITVELAPSNSFSLNYILTADEEVSDGTELTNSVSVVTRELPDPKVSTILTVVGRYLATPTPSIEASTIAPPKASPPMMDGPSTVSSPQPRAMAPTLEASPVAAPATSTRASATPASFAPIADATPV